jgi:hypothetical protein
MNPHYYLMKNKKILRLESEVPFHSMTTEIKDRLLDPYSANCMDQEQANWRVVIFRDEIMELEEYGEFLLSPEALLDEDFEEEFDLTAN